MEPLVENIPSDPVPGHAAPTDARRDPRGTHKLHGGSTQSSPTDLHCLLDLHPRTPSSIIPSHHPPPSSPRRCLHPLPRQERQLHPAHQLHRLDRRPGGICYAGHPNRSHQNYSRHRHNNQRTNPTADNPHQHHGPRHKRPRTQLRTTLDEPGHHSAEPHYDPS